MPINNQNLASPSNGFINIYQDYRTENVVNNRLALYTLSIIEPLNPHSSVFSVTFPLSPESIKKMFVAMSHVYDVQGQPFQGGVNRIVDQYGNSPVQYQIEGTTGWQRHSNDNFSFTGIQSLQQVEKLLGQFAILNQNQQQNGSANLYTMEFYDYFMQEFWQVVPVGPQIIRQDASSPILTYYNLNLMGIKPVNNPDPNLSPPNAIDQMLSLSASNAVHNIQGFSSKVSSAYQEIGGVL